MPITKAWLPNGAIISLGPEAVDGDRAQWVVIASPESIRLYVPDENYHALYRVAKCLTYNERPRRWWQWSHRTFEEACEEALRYGELLKAAHERLADRVEIARILADL